jgi:serine protease AprX
MLNVSSRPRAAHVLAVIVWIGVSLVCTSREVEAQDGGPVRRARLSSDLRQRLDAGNPRDESVILTASAARVQRIATRHGLTVKKWLDHGAVLDVPAHALAALAADREVDQLTTNQTLRAQDAVTNETIGADLVQVGTWDDEGGGEAYDGRGVGVALIDSGVAQMPQLAGRIVARVDFTKAGGRGLDAYGHGTHVAGIIASQAGRKDGDGGVAPGAHIVSLKVLDEHGLGTADNVIAAIDWTISHAKQFRIKVINLSLGGPVLQPSADDPICQAVERAYRAGLVVVVSAGNFGKSDDGKKIYGGITTPGISPYALTVGAVNTKGTSGPEDDEVASYSSRGPTLFDRLIKPDLVAPGNKIESLAAPGSTLVTKYPQLVTGSGPSARLTLSGTSMAAGVTSGATALVFSSNSGATPFVVRTALQVGARAGDEGLLQQGAGALHVPDSIALNDYSVGVAFSALALWAEAIRTGQVSFETAPVEGQTKTVVWGSHGDLILKGNWDQHNTVVWGSWHEDSTVVWGSSDETVVWGSSDETVVWGSSDETVVWGSAWDVDNTVVWGSNWDADNTVVWGSTGDLDNTVVWGSSDETVVWGSSDETVVWGSAFSRLGD